VCFWLFVSDNFNDGIFNAECCDLHIYEVVLEEEEWKIGQAIYRHWFKTYILHSLRV
jgi:hypothetical protein